MTIRFAMGSPPSSGCPLQLSSVHSRLQGEQVCLGRGGGGTQLGKATGENCCPAQSCCSQGPVPQRAGGGGPPMLLICMAGAAAPTQQPTHPSTHPPDALQRLAQPHIISQDAAYRGGR